MLYNKAKVDAHGISIETDSFLGNLFWSFEISYEKFFLFFLYSMLISLNLIYSFYNPIYPENDRRLLSVISLFGKHLLCEGFITQPVSIWFKQVFNLKKFINNHFPPLISIGGGLFLSESKIFCWNLVCYASFIL